MTRLIFEIVFLVFAFVLVMIRRPFEKQNKSNVIDVDKKSTLEKWLLGLTFLGVTALPFVFIFSSWLDFANYQLPLSLNILGAFLLIPSAIIFYRSHADLGRNWSVSLELRKAHVLITNGIYKHIRHPMYSALWIASVGQALILQNFIAGLSGMVGFGLLYFFRVEREEQMMVEQFGEDYLDYKKRTNRLMPKL
ncbi:MAG: protein-S-isoprenylcysteine O-methyltransferase [Bacteroidota bacterium]